MFTRIKEAISAFKELFKPRHKHHFTFSEDLLDRCVGCNYTETWIYNDNGWEEVYVEK